jgi:hypothetical protein
MFFHSIPHPEKTQATVLGSFNKCECEGGGVHVCKYIFVQIFATFCKHFHVHIYVQPNMCIPTNVSAFALCIRMLSASLPLMLPPSLLDPDLCPQVNLHHSLQPI